MIEKLRFLIFPIFLIILYEIFYIKIFTHALGNFSYFICVSAIVAIIGSYLSDKFSRRFFLYFTFLVCLILSIFYYLGYIKLVIILSPLFFSTPVARAAIIDNHEHFSVKNLMCILYTIYALPWCFYSFFSKSISNIFILYFLIATIISSFFFKVRKRTEVQQSILKKKSVIEKRYIISLFIIAFVLAQIVFYLNLNVLEKVKYHDKISDFAGITFLLGSIFCLLLKGKHDSLIFLAYGFLFLLSSNVLISYFFWKDQMISAVLLGELAIVGGIYNPLVTEKMVLYLGKKRRGFACGIIDFLLSTGLFIAFFVSLIFKKGNLQFLILILILVILICIFQGFSNYLSDKMIEEKKES